MRIAGTFNGTGAALRIGLGFVPDWVIIKNLENAARYVMEWNVQMSRTAESVEGIRIQGISDTDYDRSVLTKGNGIIPYYGGASFTSAQTAYITLQTDNDMRDVGTAGTIANWTLGSAANYTGNWDKECNTTYVGEGSRICIDEGGPGSAARWASVVALTSNGDQANEVTLSYPVKSGPINMLTGMYDFLGIAADKPMPDGIYTADTTLNVSGELCYIEAGTYGSDR
jgi:hypothetical protein